MKYGRIKLILAACGTILCLTGCGDGKAKISEGMAAITALDYEGALLLFEEAQALSEDERLIARGKGIAYMGLTDYEQAIACFNESLSGSNGLISDMDFDLNFYLAAAYSKNGQYAEALSCYNAILALRPEEKDAYFLRGNVRMELMDYSGAKEDFDKTISMEPANYDRIIEIYECMEHFGMGDDGKKYLQQALERKDKHMTAYNVGRMYYYLGEYQQACLALEDAKDKGGAESYLYLGKAYEATGDYNYAASVYNGYLNKYGENASVYNQLGLCEMKKKDYAKALEAFQKGKLLTDNEVLQSLSFNEIVAYEYLSEYKEALRLLEQYIKNYPDDETAKRERQFLSTR